MRRTIRKFSERTVSDSLLTGLLEAAALAPTTGGMQLYSVVVTRVEEKKKALAPSHFSQPAYINAPVILTFCADFGRFVAWCRQRKADPGYDNVQSFIAAALDAVILAQRFVDLAEDNGLGTCYLGTTTYNADKIREVLDLPELVVPVITVALGYPAENPEESFRLPVEAFVHSETYRRPTAGDIARWYTPLEERQDSKRFVEENGKETLAQVFTDVRYPRGNNELFSEKFIDVLKDAQFLKK